MADDAQEIRVSEILAALSLALDITEGQPPGHCVRCCRIGMAIGHQLDLAKDELSDLYYAILLKDLGCSSNAARISALYLTDDQAFKREFKKLDGSLPQLVKFAINNSGMHAGLAERFALLYTGVRNRNRSARLLIETRCQRGAEIALKLRFGETVAAAIRSLDERWDGQGLPEGLSEDAIPRLSQIALIAQVCDVFLTDSGAKAAMREIRARSGTWFDPVLVRAFDAAAADPRLWEDLGASDLQRKVLELEPARVRRPVDEAYLDDIAEGFARVIDAKSAFTAGHSERVAGLTDAIAAELHYARPKRRRLRRAALLHDIGKLGISSAILEKPAKLTPAEFNTVKRHPTLSRDILAKIRVFHDMLPIAGSHHEKLNGRGYPHGVTGASICMDTRIVTVADIFEALTAKRPYRQPIDPERALSMLEEIAGVEIDPLCLEGLRAALARNPSLARPEIPVAPPAREISESAG